MKLNFEKKTKIGAVITVDAWMTFEGKPVMKLKDYPDWKRLRNSTLVFVTMEITYKDPDNAKHTGKISDGRVNAYCHQWMNFSEYTKLLSDFQNNDYDYIYTFNLIRK